MTGRQLKFTRLKRGFLNTITRDKTYFALGQDERTYYAQQLVRPDGLEWKLEVNKNDVLLVSFLFDKSNHAYETAQQLESLKFDPAKPKAIQAGCYCFSCGGILHGPAATCTTCRTVNPWITLNDN